MKNTITRNRFPLFVVLALLLNSCVTYNHSHRTSGNLKSTNTGFQVKDQFVVDIDIDLSKKVNGTSAKHATKQAAFDEAYYNCITLNNIDVVVDPIWKRSNRRPFFTASFPFFFVKRYVAEVTGFSGYYKNARTLASWETKEAKDNANRKLKVAQSQMKLEKEIFEERSKNLAILSKIDPRSSEKKSSYAIETINGCCPSNNTNSNIGNNSSGNGFGNVHLLHTTENKSSLVDEYENLIDVNCISCLTEKKSATTKTLKQGFVNSVSSDAKTGGFLSGLKCKIPLLKKVLCK